MDEKGDDDRLKQVINFTIGKFCENFELNNEKIVFSKHAVALITEFVYRQSQIFASDIEDFAHHGKRKRVNSDDILLCARRSPTLLEFLKTLKVSLESVKKPEKQ